MTHANPTKRIVPLLGAVLVLSLLPAAAAHPAEPDDGEHGNVTVETSPQRCSVFVRAEHVDFDHARVELFSNVADGDDEALAERTGFGLPEREDGEKTGLFSFGFELVLDAEEAERADGATFSDVETGEHRVTLSFEPFTCDPREEPHVFIDQSDTRERDGCSVFQVRAENMPNSHGSFTVYKGTPDGEHEVWRESDFWTADEEEPDRQWSFGSPILTTDEPGPFYASASVHVDGETVTAVSEPVTIQCTPGPGDRPPSSPPPVCQTSLSAEARDGGAIFLDWDPAIESHNDVAFYRVVRDGETIAEVQTTNFLDDSTQPGETYTYNVQAHGYAAGAGTTFTSCGTIEATAVPFFGAPALGALALLGSVGAFVWMRRRG